MTEIRKMDQSEIRKAMETFEPPLPTELTAELLEFWKTAFGVPYEFVRPTLVGDEKTHNYDAIYLVRQGKRIAGTCHLTIFRADARLGGLGEVVTNPEFRGMGIANVLCAHAREIFRQWGGQVLFLGTSNPAAARIYHRLGWRKLASSQAMALLLDGDLPEAFLVNYFKLKGTVTVDTGSVADRVLIIPLILSPHDWHIMDANARILSTRYAVQTSCMGLYPRYESLAASGRGAWFAARADGSCVVGLSTARLDDDGRCQVDGFTHDWHREHWGDLMRAAIAWAAVRKAKTCCAQVAAQDEDKISLFESMGFHQAGAGEPFDVAGLATPSVLMEKAL
jgi:GNAT superfamily N-acetyltransferase